MTEAPPNIRAALLGNPNCGKTALFNLLTGSRQKVANYAGVTVERKEGLVTTPAGRRVVVLDLPGAYSLNALSADEAVTRDIVTGHRPGEPVPDLLVCVADATNLQLNLRLVLEARALGLPMVLALNMSDAARREPGRHLRPCPIFRSGPANRRRHGAGPVRASATAAPRPRSPWGSRHDCASWE